MTASSPLLPGHQGRQHTGDCGRSGPTSPRSGRTVLPPLPGHSWLDSVPSRGSSSRSTTGAGDLSSCGGCCRREAAADLAASRGLVSRAPVERRGAVDALGPPCPDPGAFAFTDPSAERRQDVPVAGVDQSLPDVREPALAGCAPVDLGAGLCPLR
jgi:hypothetical protein